MKRFLIMAMLLIMAGAGLLIAQITPADSIYFLMTDRFKDGDDSNNYTVRPRDLTAYHGGDFAGIIEKLDYIRTLGFSAIWISPVVDNQSGGYHGYWAVDFYGVEEHFGDMETLKRLVDEAHKRDIKVIIDLVVNHTGIMHPWLPDSEYSEWFHERRTIQDYENQTEAENFWLANLPDLAQENPETRKYLIDMAIWWIDELGHDGYRLDTVRHVPHEFWTDFSKAIHEKYPNFYLTGEVFHGDFTKVGSYQRAGLDGLVDFPVYFGIRDFLREGADGGQFAMRLNQAASYQDRSQMATFIDNHDVQRYINQVRSYVDEKLSQGLLFLFTYTGIPVMYYGTEEPIDGGSEHSGRRDFDWQAELRFGGLVSTFNTLRQENPALVDGDFRVIYSDSSTLAFVRTTEDQAFMTVLYNGEEPRRLSIPLPEDLQRYQSGVQLLGPEWLGDSGGSDRPGRQREARDRDVVATERQAAVEVAEGFTAAGAKTTTELEEQGKVFRVVDGNLEIELEPYTGSLVKLSTEKASGSIGLLITVISVAVAGIAALLIGLFAK
jgi:alpha-amylase